MSEQRNMYDAATGRQAHIRGGGAENDKSFDTATKLAGVALAASTTHFYRIPTAGSTQLDITLKPSSVSGTVTVTAYATLADGITQKGSATNITTPSGTTQATDSITTLAGERYWVLKIVVSGGGGLTLSQAEYTTL